MPKKSSKSRSSKSKSSRKSSSKASSSMKKYWACLKKKHPKHYERIHTGKDSKSVSDRAKCMKGGKRRSAPKVAKKRAPTKWALAVKQYCKENKTAKPPFRKGTAAYKAICKLAGVPCDGSKKASKKSKKSSKRLSKRSRSSKKPVHTRF